MPNLQLVAKCENAFEANEVLQNQKVDLMFLDIQMPQLNGVDFVKSLANPPCVVLQQPIRNLRLKVLNSMPLTTW